MVFLTHGDGEIVATIRVCRASFLGMVCSDAFKIEANKFRCLILARNPIHVHINFFTIRKVNHQVHRKLSYSLILTFELSLSVSVTLSFFVRPDLKYEWGS
jgi:hypothetical protein